MAKKQFFGLRYPFTDNDFNKFFVDLNTSQKDKVRSQIMHVVFTPKGQRIRNPEFGTDLIKFIFEPNDSVTWTAIKEEVSDAINKWVAGCELKNIQVVQTNDDNREIFVRIDYSVRRGNQITNDSIITQL